MGDSYLQIKLFSRLHLTLISMHDAGYRRNGGFGFAISEPSVTVKFQKADGFELIDNRSMCFTTQEIVRVSDVIQKEIEQKNFKQSCKIDIHGDVPSHMGFGSGTAIRLASIEGLYLLNDYAYTSDELIVASGRGGTSGVGVYTYFHGGYSFDVGRKSGVFAPSCSFESECAKPLHVAGGEMPDWKIGICIPNSICPKSEAEEKEFFASTCPIEPHESYETTYHALFGVLAGVKDGCIDSFCEAVKNIQNCRWKRAERSLYGEKLMEIESALYAYGAKAVGMSSLGPSLFFAGADVDVVCERVKERLDCTVFVSKLRNAGREIIYG